jgi:hypothetical protein
MPGAHKGVFNDVIIGNYNKEADAEGFQQISIVKYSGDDRISQTSSDQIKINEALTLFDNLYLVKDDEYLYSTYKKYRLSFHNINTYEFIDIDIFDDSHIYVSIRLVDKKVDEKKKIIQYDRDYISYSYYIQNGKVNLNKLDALFNSIDG